jgi:peptide/nickel transport system ATP-binding protein
MSRYPHQLSGGLLQRSAIATALSCGPELVIADEPTSALDVIVRAGVIDAFTALVRDLGTAVIVISHDLHVLERLADRIAVMYAGRIVEFGPAADLLTSPRHPYPAALLRASLLGSEPRSRLTVIEGQPPSLPGTFAPCAYAPRCLRADETCWTIEPRYDWPAETGKACHHPVPATPDEAAA